jgi:hypothetical protein
MGLQQLFCTEFGVARRRGDTLELLTGPEDRLALAIAEQRLEELAKSTPRSERVLANTPLRAIASPKTVFLEGLGGVDEPLRELSHGNSPVQTPILA